ncbi:MAG: hypothetical protein MUP21_03265, partial [Dehalococcoidia bacterium]|nr:hypothetical protein [Dehalococcoidia bacterium]
MSIGSMLGEGSRQAHRPDNLPDDELCDAIWIEPGVSTPGFFIVCLMRGTSPPEVRGIAPRKMSGTS